MLDLLFKAPSIDWERKWKARRERAEHPLLKNFYQSELPNKKTALSDIQFLAMDFETTGLDCNKDEIITIGVVPFNLDRIYLNQARHWIVKPARTLKESSIVIHGITHSDITNALDIRHHADDILNTLKNHVIVAHYHKIERYFLDNALKLRLGEGVEFPIVDTMIVEELILKKQFGLIDRLQGKQKPSVRLNEIRSRYQLPNYSPHHALTDAIATAELLQAQIKHHYQSDLPIERFWL